MTDSPRQAGEATQTAVAFDNRSGLRLFGVLHVPARPSRGGLAVILLSPGVKMRVGPQCLYRRMADHFLALGVTVLRFDFYGLGDSEGSFVETMLRDFYNHIEVGRFVDDTLDAMAWMERECGTKRFVLSGLCGGAITGLLAGARDSRVAGLIGLGITPVLASRAADQSRYMTTDMLDKKRRDYYRKATSLRSWFRLLTFRADNRAIWRSLTTPVRRRLQSAGVVATVPRPESDNANPLFPPAFFNMLESARPMLLVFGGSDRLHAEFEEKFVARHRERLGALPRGYDVHVIEQANHVLSLTVWQDEMLKLAAAWLERHFAGDLTPA